MSNLIRNYFVLVWRFIIDLTSTVLNKLLNMNKRKLGVIVIIVFVSVLILFPFIDTNFFYDNRIKNRIDILQKITELDMDKISRNKNDHTIEKFISGGALWWLLGIIVLFFYNIFNNEDNEKSKNWETRIDGFILCAIIGGLIGFICSIVPTIFNIWVNYIIIPILFLILMILLLYKTTSNK